MPVDNELYNRLSETWWDENEALGILRSWFGPVRFGYFRRILLDKLARDPQGLTVLDVGCGGGLLAEDFARLGFLVFGVDPSEASLATARKHAEQSGLAITYRKGVGEQLPFAGASFDIAVCCDVLEHVNDVELVIQEIARVLKPGGLFFYDTINRTPLTWLAHIKLAQEWSSTSFLPPNLHDWKKFIKTRELVCKMQKHHLQNQDLRGISQRAHPLTVIRLCLKRKRGVISLAEMGKHMDLHESDDLSASYMGYAVKMSV